MYDNKSRNDLLDLKFIETGITMRSPEIEPAAVNELTLDLIFHHELESVASVEIISPMLTTNVILSTVTQTFEFKDTQSLTYNDDFKFMDEYPVAITMTLGNGNTITSNYSLPLSVKSIHWDSIEYPLESEGKAWREEDTLIITPLSTGAGVQTLAISGNIVNGDSFVTNIEENHHDPIIIHLDNPAFKLPLGIKYE